MESPSLLVLDVFRFYTYNLICSTSRPGIGQLIGNVLLLPVYLLNIQGSMKSTASLQSMLQSNDSSAVILLSTLCSFSLDDLVRSVFPSAWIHHSVTCIQPTMLVRRLS